MPRSVLFVTHPEVVIDPAVPVPRWKLSPKGVARMTEFARDPAVAKVTSIYASDETKARDGARILADAKSYLKPGGTLITSSPFMIAVHKVPKDYWRFTKEAMEVLLESYSSVETYSWGNPGSVNYLMDGMMVTTREAIDAGAFDLTNVEKFAIDVWAYATK